MQIFTVIFVISFIGMAQCLSKSDIERRVLARGWRFAAPTRQLDAPEAPEADADAPRARTFVRQAHLQWEHDEVDSRAVSENVDLDKVDDGGFERLRRALHSMHPRVSFSSDLPRFGTYNCLFRAQKGLKSSLKWSFPGRSPAVEARSLEVGRRSIIDCGKINNRGSQRCDSYAYRQP